MKRDKTGRYEATVTGDEPVRAFVPAPLPPAPPIDLSPLQGRLETALLALGRLDALSTLLPDTTFILYSYVRKEAVLSSQIEGTQSSLSDLLLFETEAAPGAPFDDVVEVSNYVAAMEHGLARLRGGFPLSNRLLKEIHAKLLKRGRGSEKSPGEFRKSQNWIGGSRPGNAHFVPPPAHLVLDCMSELETFLHESRQELPVLVRAALAHLQFESIHPFLDGNGRVGRLLITFLLCHDGVIREPLLYLSLFFKQHRSRYYALLDRVRNEGDWEEWLAFFLEGVAQTAEGAVATARRLVELFHEDRERIQGEGKKAGSALRVHQALQERPVASLPAIAGRTGLSYPATQAGMEVLERLGLVRELTGRRRNRLFGYDRYIAILSEGTETPPRGDGVQAQSSGS
ncbi:MAG TPA: Fic family protein [Planctomycetes bacterium]|nr:Fic family protein [Planctomycetota bacterium]